MPAEAEFSRRIGLIVGGASGIGREAALLLARRGAHLVVADFDEAGARKVAEQAGALASPEFVSFTGVDLVSVHSLAAAVGKTILEFGGLDFIVNTAAIYPLPGPDGELSEGLWAKTFVVNVTGNYFLANSVHWALEDQKLAASLVLTGSANASRPRDPVAGKIQNFLFARRVRRRPPKQARGFLCAADIAQAAHYTRSLCCGYRVALG